jgi:hypothetical protein
MCLKFHTFLAINQTGRKKTGKSKMTQMKDKNKKKTCATTKETPKL